MLCAIPPSLFSRGDFLSGNDNGRDRRFRAESRAFITMQLTGNLGRFPNDSRARYGASPRFEIRADFGRFFSELVGVNLKSNPASLLIYQHTVDEWQRRQGGCSQPRNSERDGKSSGGPMHPTSDECLAWTTSPTRLRKRRK